MERKNTLEADLASLVQRIAEGSEREELGRVHAEGMLSRDPPYAPEEMCKSCKNCVGMGNVTIRSGCCSASSYTFGRHPATDFCATTLSALCENNLKVSRRGWNAVDSKTEFERHGMLLFYEILVRVEDKQCCKLKNHSLVCVAPLETVMLNRLVCIKGSN